VAFEQYKTQVLLLHSEQSRLDVLSKGFNDRYSVHCATSGTEALNTLGVTPIHVIVSAHDLPGMSGLDALREAKKRSPETITILMAGADAGDGLEALVSEKEVFQVIRGEISAEALAELVDSATRTARLMALSESANDTSADVDEPGEHIVMETADNGSFVVSDGTGELPVLKPEKLGAAPSAGGRRVDVLVLTQDDEFLETVRESARGTHHVHHAARPGQAEDFVRNFPVGVLVTDAALAGANVESLTQRMRAHQPRLVAIVAGRRDDGEMLMDLINRGQVYRFLLKPVSPGRARLAVEASIRYHLEAPDQSFSGRGAAAKPAQQGTAPAGKARAADGRPSARSRTAPPAPAAPSRPIPPAANRTGSSPAGDGLDDAFDEGSSFTETMTGIAVSFGKSISNAASSFKSAKKEPPAATPGAAAGASASPPDRPPKAAAPRPAQGPSDATPSPKAKATPAPAPKTTPKPDRPTRSTTTPVVVPQRPQTPASADDSADGGWLNVRTLGFGGTVLAAVALGAFLLVGGEDEPVLPAADRPAAVSDPADSPAAVSPENELRPAETEAAPVAAAADSPAESTAADAATADAANPVPAQADRAIARLLEQARQARDDGDLYAPAGRNAVEFYLEARRLDPDSADVGGELAAVIDEVYGRAETALLENRTTEASRALRVLGLADPGSQRLSFLNAQLQQQQLRVALDEARAAIREGRFEDAGQLLARAESVAGSVTAEIESLSQELAAARNDQQLDEVLALAGQRLAEDRLLAPANDNARYYYELALNIDAGNAAASQGLLTVAGKLVLLARAAIDAGNFDEARAMLDDAGAVNPEGSEVLQAQQALADAMAARADREEAAAALAAAEQVAREQTAAAAAAVAAAEQAKTASAESTADVAAENSGGDRQADQGAPRLAAATAPTAESPAPSAVSISALNRIKYVAPSYPRAAQRRNQSGFVDVEFTVDTDGAVVDIDVRASEPGDTFVDSAVEAVEQWEFEPVIENGVPARKRVAVRMSFNLQ